VPAYRPDATVHRWEAHGFAWALSTGRPLDTDDLARVVAAVLPGEILHVPRGEGAPDADRDA
jgi:hypothetical protein